MHKTSIQDKQTGLKPHIIKAIKGVFEHFPQVDRAILYGSRAKGTYHNGSDIDLTIEGHELDLSQLFRIEEALDDLMLPYKIDLSIRHKIQNQALQEHIDRYGKLIYENQPD
jgi:predicted nucleotidyltransferase